MVGLTVNELQERIIELEVENSAQFQQIEVLQHEVTRLERANKIMEQRLRRIGDAAVEGRTVDGL